MVNPLRAEHTTTHVVPPSAEAGVLDRTIEKEYEAKPLKPHREVPLLEVDIPEEELDVEEGVSVQINSIHIEGNTLLKEKVLRRVASRYEERKLSMQDIRRLCAEIRACYVKEGYFLARAYPPVQNIEEGELEIAIVEGTLGNICVQGNVHYSERFIRAYFEKFIGKPLQYDAFFRSLMLLNENLDLAAGAIFEKGQEVGTADVILKVSDERPLHLYLDGNNYGSTTTSLYRTGARLDYGNIFFDGDTASIAGVVGSPVESLEFIDAIYNFPLTKSGLNGKVAYLYNRFKVRRSSDLRLRGKTEIASAEISYAIQRTRSLSTDIYGSFEYKQVKNYALGKVTSSDRLRVARLGFDLNYFDRLRGNNYFDLTFHQGIPDILGGSPSVSKHSSRQGAGGLFSYFYLDYKRMQNLPKNFFIILNLSGQYSFYKLPLPEQFYIGGVDTIRGYPLATALGDSGYYANFELRIPPPGANAHVFGTKKRWKEVLQFLVFVDNGGVYLKSKERPLDKGFVDLTSTGAGLRVYGPWHLDLNFDVGFPLTERHKSSTCIWYGKINLSI